MYFQGFLEAIRDFHFLLIAQGKLDILRVQNEVDSAADSCQFWGDFLAFSQKSLWFWSTVYSGINLIFDPRNIKFSMRYGQKMEVAKRLSETLIFQRHFHAFPRILTENNEIYLWISKKVR